MIEVAFAQVMRGEHGPLCLSMIFFRQSAQILVCCDVCYMCVRRCDGPVRSVEEVWKR